VVGLVFWLVCWFGWLVGLVFIWFGWLVDWFVFWLVWLVGLVGCLAG
jgi:hypothetical protein